MCYSTAPRAAPAGPPRIRPTMTRYASEFLRVLDERGFVHQVTDAGELDARAATGPIAAYIGFDCTAPSLHVGSLVSIMLLRHLQQAGHRPIVLMGGGTTKVGDPSGRDDSRQLLSDADIAHNMSRIRHVFAKFMAFGEGESDALMVDNADWLDHLEYIRFLREYGRHFSVNRMLGFDSVKLRLDRQQPLSFLEFNYMILQAYDFVELGRRYGCVLQMGGSDQWGNIVNGVELGRRVDDATLYGLTTPLITTASGAKMGKTAAGAVWLDADQVSPYDYWQYWRNTDDADVGRFLRLFTELPIAEIEPLERLRGEEVNEAKKILANEATRLCHGADAADQAAEAARGAFEEGLISAHLPTFEIPGSDLESGVAAFDLLHRTGLCASASAARKLIRGGGARINDQVIADEKTLVTRDHVTAQGVAKVSAGRKRHVLVRPI